MGPNSQSSWLNLSHGPPLYSPGLRSPFPSWGRWLSLFPLPSDSSFAFDISPARRCCVWASPHEAARSAVTMATAQPRPGRMVSNSSTEGLNSQLFMLFALYERGTWSKCPSSGYLGTSDTFEIQIWIQILQVCSAFYKITGTRTCLAVPLQSDWFCQERSARFCSSEFSNSCPLQKFLFIQMM